MDDARLASLLDRRQAGSTKSAATPQIFFALCAGPAQMVTFRVFMNKDHEVHHSMNSGQMQRCVWERKDQHESIRVTYTTGWSFRVEGRGLAEVHRALVGRCLDWVRGAKLAERDDRSEEVFVFGITAYRPPVNPQPPAPPSRTEKKSQ